MDSIVIHNKQVAERVTFSDLKPNSPFYLENPFANIHTPVHYPCENLEPDTPIWVVFSKMELDCGINPWIIGQQKKQSTQAIGKALFSGFDHNLCGGH